MASFRFKGVLGEKASLSFFLERFQDHLFGQSSRLCADRIPAVSLEYFLGSLRVQKVLFFIFQGDIDRVVDFRTRASARHYPVSDPFVQTCGAG